MHSWMGPATIAMPAMGRREPTSGESRSAGTGGEHDRNSCVSTWQDARKFSVTCARILRSNFIAVHWVGMSASTTWVRWLIDTVTPAGDFECPFLTHRSPPTQV
jgi:hypothetical protein